MLPLRGSQQVYRRCRPNKVSHNRALVLPAESCSRRHLCACSPPPLFELSVYLRDLRNSTSRADSAPPRLEASRSNADPFSARLLRTSGPVCRRCRPSKVFPHNRVCALLQDCHSKHRLCVCNRPPLFGLSACLRDLRNSTNTVCNAPVLPRVTDNIEDL